MEKTGFEQLAYVIAMVYFVYLESLNIYIETLSIETLMMGLL